MIKWLKNIHPVYIAIALCAAVWLYVVINYMVPDEDMQQIAFENALLIDTTEINGGLVKVGERGSIITNTAINNTYWCMTIVLRDSLRKTPFQWFAKAGDSIVKHPYTDTLLLIKEDKIYTADIYLRKDVIELRPRR